MPPDAAGNEGGTEPGPDASPAAAPRGTAGGTPSLDRTLGVWEALAIGTGTMVGAGIFIFPGIAGAEAGTAALLSFALGAVVALLVALPASELATALPRSGGGYQYVSRSMGALAGTVVGIGQWIGLIFASGFYLAGFGHYLRELILELGFQSVPEARWLAFGGALFLTLLGVLSTRHAGRLQNLSVGILLFILSTFLVYGLASSLIPGGEGSLPRDFAPEGLGAVFPTAALIFTSYLGFIQITNVAGDIREPARNIPRAMLGSVALVGALYLLTLLLTTSVLSPSELSEFGETALAEVARSLLGVMGALALMAAGLLATLSSANASILGSSRTAFALSRDRLLPLFLGRIHPQSGTPVRALVLTGGAVAGLALLGRLELLAEVASILHLLMYGLICLALLWFRAKQLEGYRPVFRAPGYPWLPALGGLLSFALVGWMEPRALLVGGGVTAAAALWYAFYGREVTLRGNLPEPPGSLEE